MKKLINKLFGKKPKEPTKQNLILKKGSHVFEMSLLDGKVKLAKMEKNEETGALKLIENENCIYIPAINKIVAVKKFNKILNTARKNEA